MRIALVQLTTSRSLEDNLGLVRSKLAEAAARKADLVVFPEATMRAFGHSLVDIAEPLDGPWAGAVRAAADEAGVAVVVGMFTPGEGERVRNTLLVHGRGVEAHYDKIHLYDAFGFAESDTVTPGTEPVRSGLDGVTFGLATCYDVRFPALFQATADAGAQVQLVCASWAPGPGKAEQWDLLVRARPTRRASSWPWASPTRRPPESRRAPARRPGSAAPPSSTRSATSWSGPVRASRRSTWSWTWPRSPRPARPSRSWPTGSASDQPGQLVSAAERRVETS